MFHAADGQQDTLELAQGVGLPMPTAQGGGTMMESRVCGYSDNLRHFVESLWAYMSREKLASVPIRCFCASLVMLC